MTATVRKIELCDKRRAILAQPGHLLVSGGPGSGKTTIALLKAKERSQGGLSPGQEILFLSFSRAAVRQVIEGCAAVLTSQERALIRVQTYHAFCMEVLQSHGRLLAGRTCRFLVPSDERLEKSGFKGDWLAERRRLADEESTFCFDLFASAVATLFERSVAVRSLYGNKYPLIVVDEFQDTDDDQWRILRQLATFSDLFCLADPDQRIFEYRGNVDPQRIDKLREAFGPAEFDLGTENHRSPATSILEFADAVYRNQAPLPKSKDVAFVRYYPQSFETFVHASVLWTFGELRKRRVEQPSIAVMCRSNPFLAKLSMVLSEEHTFEKKKLRPVEHDVVWDADLAAAAAATVGSVMEWSEGSVVSLANTLSLVARFYRLRNAEHPSVKAAENARKAEEAAAAVLGGLTPRVKMARDLGAAFQSGISMSGNPVEDWKRARQVFKDILQLNDLYREAHMVRLFGARDALASGLSNLWLSNGSYKSASAVVKTILEGQRLLSSERHPRGCMLMTIHKAKGKEFDGVVLVEGNYESQFLDLQREPYPFERSRRLLRVALTRAKCVVTVVRSNRAYPLVGGGQKT